MKTAFLVKWTMLLLVVAAAPGCVTRALWQDAQLGTRHQPAGDPHLRIFRTSDTQDMMVLYDDSREGHAPIVTRAYLLRQNEDRIARQRTPKFVKAGPAAGWQPVPVFPNSNSSAASAAPPLYAILSEDKMWFELYANGALAGTFPLPIYDDGMGKTERIALTPLAALADASIVGGAVAVVAGAIYGESYSSGPVDYQPGPHVGP